MNPIMTAIIYELQETGNEYIVAAKVAGFLKQQLNMDEESIAMELRHFFRNSNDKGQRNPAYHQSCY